MTENKNVETILKNGDKAWSCAKYDMSEWEIYH